MPKVAVYLLVFLLLLLAPTGLRYVHYYSLSGREQTAVPVYNPVAIPEVPTPASTTFVDAPARGSGLILLDQAHDNQFTLEEMGYFNGRLAARGFELVPYTGGDLATALRPANALVVFTPVIPYNDAEILAVRRFVDRGGRLLMVGDPTRYSFELAEDPILGFVANISTDKLPLNSLANAFDLVFNGDYLYNTVENEGNFQNIILPSASFAESGLPDGLEKLAFYGSHSLDVGPTGKAWLTADDNTWSSATDRPGGLVLAATDQNKHVLALGDIHFLTAPYHTVFDNSAFIAHVADFLTDTAERGLVLGDFPYFYQTAVNLVYSGSPELGADAFDEIIALQAAFQRANQTLNLAAAPDATADTLYLGLYNQTEDVADLLARAGVSLVIDPPIVTLPEEGASSETVPEEAATVETTAVAQEETTRLIQSDLGQVQMAGTALILLNETDKRRTVVVLAASAQGLENTLHRLIDLIPLNADYALSDCLLQGNTALCPTDVADEAVEMELLTSGPADEKVEPAPETPAPGDSGLEKAADQGRITLGETVEGTLAAAEQHAWTFNQGPAVIDIVLEAAEDIDGVVELYGPDKMLIDSSDTTFAGESEQLLGVDIPDDGDYTLVVRDFFDDGGSYTLTVTEGTLPEQAARQTIESIFILADDDGVALAGGATAVASLATLLETTYTVTTWSVTEDGPLEAGAIDSYDLLIWDSGDYRDEEGFEDEETAVALAYLDASGLALIIGASPTILGAVDLRSLSDVEVTGEDSLLLQGLTVGQNIGLDQTYDTAQADLFSELGVGGTNFLVRGSASENAGDAVGIAAIDEFTGLRTVFILAPYTAFPADIQQTLLENALAWLTG